MTRQELIKLKRSDDAPYNHDEYTFWLHDKILDRINYELREFRESQPIDVGRYKVCNQIIKDFKSLKPCK